MTVADEQEFELYYYDDSIASQMARLALAEKGIAEGLKNLERQLAHGECYLLEDCSAADLMLSVHFSRLEEVALGDILDWDKLSRTHVYWCKSDGYDAMEAVYNCQANPHLPELDKEIERQLEGQLS